MRIQYRVVVYNEMGHVAGIDLLRGRFHQPSCLLWDLCNHHSRLVHLINLFIFIEQCCNICVCVKPN